MAAESRETEPPSYELIRAIEQCDACESCLFDPLYSVVDADAVDAICDPQTVGRTARGRPRISVETDFCTVSIVPDSGVSIQQVAADGGQDEEPSSE